MKNHIAGALYGQALGDAFGMPAELWGISRTRQYFKEPITELLDGPAENDVAFNYKKGQFTDDTGQALVLLDSIAATNYVPDPCDIARRMLEWAEKENAFENNILGPTSKVALANFRDGIDASKFTNKALSNGSAMRIGPIGTLFRPEQKQEIVDYVYGVSQATHTSDVTIAAAAMIAVGVASAIVNDDFEKVLEDILAIERLGYDKGAETSSPSLGARVRIGVDIARQYLAADEPARDPDANPWTAPEGCPLTQRDFDFLDKIYRVVGAGVPIIESTPAAIAIAYYAKDPNKCAMLCGNLGGDTDTIGAMATAICGAFTGLSAFKEEYVELLRSANHQDFDQYLEILVKGREVLA